MRTLPANFSTGLTNHYRLVWLVKLTGSSAVYYWLTNKRGNTATSDVALTESSVSKTYDSSLLTKSIDGSEVSAIGEIEQSVDILMGGAVGSASDVDLTLLNQLRLDTTLAGYGLENRAVSIFMGFIPDGATPTLEITDMICLWTGVFNSHEENYSQVTCYLTDARDQRHKSIPQTVIDEEAYPLAPKESIGQVLPILYGDFVLPNPSATNSFYELFSLAPSICIHRLNNIFCIAGHITHTAGGTFYSDGNMKAPAQVGIFNGTTGLTPPTNDLDDSGISTITITAGQVIGTAYQLFSSAGIRNNISDFSNAIDGDPTTYATITNASAQIIELALDGIATGKGIIGMGSGFSTCTLYAIVDSIVSAQSYRWGRIDAAGTEELNVMSVGSGIYYNELYENFPDVSDLSTNCYYIRDNENYTPSAESTKIYAMGIIYRFIIAGNIVKLEKGRDRKSGYRRGSL